MENLPDIAPHDHEVGERFGKIARGSDNLSMHRGTPNTRIHNQSLRSHFTATRLPVNLRSRVLSRDLQPSERRLMILGPMRVYPMYRLTIENNLSTISLGDKDVQNSDSG
jgi:hypothetical protein